MKELRPETLLQNRYQILSKVGEGGFAVVYRAQDCQLNREVAIKVLKITALDQGEESARFQREAKLLAQLQHKNIVSTFAFDILNDNKTPYLVMEYLQGKSLRTLLEEKKGKLDFQQVEFILQGVCQGLSHAHKAGIVHRDLSPANIFLSQYGTETIVKIVDFGLSRIYSSEAEQSGKLTSTGALMGNPPYMSPEQTGTGKVDQRSDIYALGCILYECLSGKQAFVAEQPIAIIYMQNKTYPPEPKFDWMDHEKEELYKYLALRCLQKNPDLRFQNCDELLQTVKSMLPAEAEKLSPWAGSRNDRNAAPAFGAWQALALFCAFAVIVTIGLILARSAGDKKDGIKQLESPAHYRASGSSPRGRIDALFDLYFGSSPERNLSWIVEDLDGLIPLCSSRKDQLLTIYFIKSYCLNDLQFAADSQLALGKALSCCELPNGKRRKDVSQVYADMAKTACYYAKDYKKAEYYAQESLRAYANSQKEADPAKLPWDRGKYTAFIFDWNILLHQNYDVLAASAFYRNEFVDAEKYALLALPYGHDEDGLARFVMANIRWKTGKVADANSWIESILQIAKKSSDKAASLENLQNAADWGIEHENKQLAKQAFAEEELLCKSIIESSAPANPLLHSPWNQRNTLLFAFAHLSEIYCHQARFKEAVELRKQSFEIVEKSDEHSTSSLEDGMLTQLDRLAMLYVHQSMFADAELLCKRSLALKEHELRPDHPRAAIDFWLLGEISCRRGKYHEAELLYRRALSLALAANEQAEYSFSLAETYRFQRKWLESASYYQRAISCSKNAIMPQYFGFRATEARLTFIPAPVVFRNFPASASYLFGLAECYRLQGKFAEAFPLYQQALSIKEKVLAPDDAELEPELQSLAEVCSLQGKKSEAREIEKRLKSIQAKTPSS